MTQEIQLKQEELETLKNFEQRYFTIVKELGEMSMMEGRINRRRQELYTDSAFLDQEQNTYLKTLQDKYGPGSVDLDSGIFRPA